MEEKGNEGQRGGEEGAWEEVGGCGGKGGQWMEGIGSGAKTRAHSWLVPGSGFSSDGYLAVPDAISYADTTHALFLYVCTIRTLRTHLQL